LHYSCFISNILDLLFRQFVARPPSVHLAMSYSLVWHMIIRSICMYGLSMVFQCSMVCIMLSAGSLRILIPHILLLPNVFVAAGVSSVPLMA
jgi:hypothetical protein